MISRAKAIAAILAEVSAELSAMESLAGDARDEATSGETKSEGKYDTRATEASYLARGQAWRIVELGRLSAWLKAQADTGSAVDPTVRLGCLVQITGARTELLYLAPIGGAKADLEGTIIRVISPSSPLGRAMTGLEAGDGFEIETPRGLLEYEIEGVG
jgi:transcription elongation GreA/GreB family factor